MGYKPIYELTTETGRAINTTGNHPYLTPQGWVKVAELKEGDSVAVPGLDYTPNSLTSSEVEKTLTTDWCFNALSLDQIGQPNFNANAKYSTSSGSGHIDFASFKKSLNSVTGTNWTFQAITFSRIPNTPIFIFALDITTFRYLLSSFNAKLGEYNSNEELNNNLRVEENFLKEENMVLKSTTNLNHINPCFFNASNLPCLASLPSLKQSSSVRSEFSSSLSSFLSNKALLTFSDKNSLIVSDQFNSGNSSILCFNSCGIDNVMLGILVPPKVLLNAVDTVKDVELYKPFDSEICFDKIVSIRIHEPQHVYDLMIENTHNFIANGIIAHNTYISGNVSLADNLTVGGDNLYVDSSSSNVGIGTASPATMLEVTNTAQQTNL